MKMKTLLADENHRADMSLPTTESSVHSHRTTLSHGFFVRKFFKPLMVSVSLAGVSTSPAVEFNDVITLESPNAQTEGWFGSSISAVPDVTGDGLVDFAIGAPYEDPGNSPRYAGRVYIYNGVTQELVRELKLANESSNTSFGNGVEGIEDINDNGMGEIIVTGSGTRLGRVLVIDGSSGEVIHTLRTPDTNARTASAVPDVNGDGRPEIAVSGDPNTFVLVFDGLTGLELYRVPSPGGESGSLFGVRHSGVPDVNGDGSGDLIVAAHNERALGRPIVQNVGRAYVFNGADGELLHTLFSPSPQDGGGFALGVSGLDDVNGDGLGDIGVRDPGLNQAIIFDGATGEVIHQLSPPAPDVHSYFGKSQTFQDVNGDGTPEILVTGSADIRRSQYLYLYNGASGELIQRISYDFDSNSPSTVVLPDVNNDGKVELLLAQQTLMAGGFPEGGQAFIYLSVPSLGIEFLGFDGLVPTLRVSGKEGGTILIEASSNLESWNTVDEITLGPEAMEVPDPGAQGNPIRFYRASE